MQCCLIAFTHSRTSFKIGFYPDLLLLYQLSFPSILNSLLPLQSSPGIDSISRNHFLCLSLRTAPHLLTFYHEKAAVLQVISSGSTFNSILLLFLPHLQLTSASAILNPSKSSMKSYSTSSKLLCMLMF